MKLLLVLLLAIPVHDDKLGLSFTLPEGFRDFPRGREEPSTILAYERGVGTGDFAIVGVGVMSGSIGREHLKTSDLPGMDGVAFDLRREKWKEFEIDVLEGRAGPVYVLVAQLPFKPRAIQIKVVGPKEKEAELLALLRSILATVDGPTNWLTLGERFDKGAPLALLLIIGGALWWKRRRRRNIS